jgi:hypothetical protein
MPPQRLRPDDKAQVENQNLEDLAQDKVYEFTWSFNPLPLVGGTGSPGNSVAIA